MHWITITIPVVFSFFLLTADTGRAESELVPLDRNGAVAFLGMTLLDTSLDGLHNGQESELKRTSMLEELVRERFTKEGFKFASIDPIQSDLDRIGNPAQCNGCDIRLARVVGAPYVMVGEVHKVSNLILSVNLVLRDVRTEKNVRARVVDIRGNTDQSWQRGINYILNNHFFSDIGN